MQSIRSAQGRAVLAALQHLDHPTADEVFAHVRREQPRIGLATVYRNLDRLVAAGYARTHQVAGVRRFDANVEAHLHIHDVATGRLMDVPIPDAVQAALEDLARQHGLEAPRLLIEVQGNQTKHGVTK